MESYLLTLRNRRNFACFAFRVLKNYSKLATSDICIQFRRCLRTDVRAVEATEGREDFAIEEGR
jgi:hypothetical protein